jgi:hypothetical protein
VREPLTLGRYFADGAGEPQRPADVAVVMPTTLQRNTIAHAVASVYRQAFAGRIQLAIGVDVLRGDIGVLDRLLEQRPANVSAVVLSLPYSTATRHGGVHNPMDGGSLRAVLSLAANAGAVAYLDDDNTWTPEHIALLHETLRGKTYAFSQRMLVDDPTDTDLGVDVWHSVGPGRGEYAATGGFVDPNCLLVDKVRAAHRLGQWAQTWNGRPNGWGADKRFFTSIAAEPFGEVPQATVRYRIARDNRLHQNLKTSAAS